MSTNNLKGLRRKRGFSKKALYRCLKNQFSKLNIRACINVKYVIKNLKEKCL